MNPMMHKKTVPYDGMFTLSAPSPKWIWNAQGQLVQVPAGQPVFGHDPVTGQSLGQRVEPVEKANSWENSVDFAGVSGENRFSYTSANSIFASGSSWLITNNGGNPSRSLQGAPVASDGRHSFWVILESGGTAYETRIGIYNTNVPEFIGLVRYVWATNELISSSTPGGEDIAKIGPFTLSEVGPNGGRLVMFGVSAAPSSSGTLVPHFYPTGFDESTDTVYYHHAQFEQLGPSSPIRTSGSAVIRAADVVKIEDVDAAEWYGEEAAFCIEFDQLQISEEFSSFILDDGGSTRWFYTTTSGALIAYDGENICSSGVDARNKKIRAVCTWNPSQMKIMATGGNVFERPHNGNLGSASSVNIFSARVSGWLSQLIAKKRFLTDAEMQAWVNGSGS